MEAVPLLFFGIFLLAAATVLCGAVVLGLALAIVFRRRAAVRVAGLLLVLAGVAVASSLIVAVVYFTEETDLNPAHVRDQDITMKWVSTGWLVPQQSVDLKRDGTFTMSGVEQVTGRWSRYDWNLTLTPAAGDAEQWRVVDVDGTYRLLRHYCGVEHPCDKRRITFRAQR